MKTYLENSTENTFYQLKYDGENDCLIIISGEIGTKGKRKKMEAEDVEDQYGSPPEWAFDELIDEKIKEGFIKVLQPMDLLKQIESINEIKIKGRLRDFYETGEILIYNNKYHKEFECYINFDSRYSKSYSDEEYDKEVIIIAGKVSEDGYEDEQNWIGINIMENDITVYDLFTSGEYDLSYDSFDEFLAGF
jgi:predicted DNA-binding WGR domain protein